MHTDQASSVSVANVTGINLHQRTAEEGFLQEQFCHTHLCRVWVAFGSMLRVKNCRHRKYVGQIMHSSTCNSNNNEDTSQHVRRTGLIASSEKLVFSMQ